MAKIRNIKKSPSQNQERTDKEREWRRKKRKKKVLQTSVIGTKHQLHRRRNWVTKTMAKTYKTENKVWFC